MRRPTGGEAVHDAVRRAAAVLLAVTPLLALACLVSGRASAADKIVVGSKAFTEGYVLGEIAAQAVESAESAPVSRKLGMGSTGIVFEALKSGAIDVYSDYTGTLSEAILKRPDLKSLEEIRAALLAMDLVVSEPLGFDDTYALAVKEEYAQKRDLRSISDLKRVEGELRGAFSYEFMDRKDGFSGMAQAYQLHLRPQNIKRMEHSLTFQAIDDGAVDVIDLYSTDAKIEKSKLRVLRDDRGYFPVYQAVWVARREFTERQPRAWQALLKLQGAISERAMIDMNAQADIQHVSFAKIAAQFLGAETPRSQSLKSSILQRTREHLWLVGIALMFSVLVGIPLGLAAVRFHAAGQAILIASALIQTVPSLALLAIKIACPAA
jgi:osmoprotectant transport system permease protein